MNLCNPVEYLSDENGRVRAMKIQRMELGEPDESGRRSPQPIPGAVEEIPVDLVIVSVGVSPNPLIPNAISLRCRVAVLLWLTMPLCVRR